MNIQAAKRLEAAVQKAEAALVAAGSTSSVFNSVLARELGGDEAQCLEYWRRYQSI
jgi:hypothetical protein